MALRSDEDEEALEVGGTGDGQLVGGTSTGRVSRREHAVGHRSYPYRVNRRLLKPIDNWDESDVLALIAERIPEGQLYGDETLYDTGRRHAEFGLGAAVGDALADRALVAELLDAPISGGPTLDHYEAVALKRRVTRLLSRACGIQTGASAGVRTSPSTQPRPGARSMSRAGCYLRVSERLAAWRRGL